MQNGQKNTNELLQKVKEMTKENDHSNARLYIAQFFNLKRYIIIFKNILEIHKETLWLDYNLQLFRDSQTTEMLETIGKQFGEELKNKIHSCL